MSDPIKAFESAFRPCLWSELIEAERDEYRAFAVALNNESAETIAELRKQIEEVNGDLDAALDEAKHFCDRAKRAECALDAAQKLAGEVLELRRRLEG